MFEASNLLCIYVETSLHAGTGRGLGTIDLPIQRERITGYPVVQGSGLKGRLRAEARPGLSNGEFEAIFGPETDNADAHAGALSCGDAKILLLPVRSLAGVFAWITSRQVLSRLFRDLAAIPALQTVCQELEIQLAIIRTQPAEPASDADTRWALVGSESSVKAGERVVLEEFAFAPKSGDDGVERAVNKIGKWIAKYTLPQTDEYQYWRENLPKHLVILPEDDFRDFCLFGMEVVTRIKLKTESKTVDKDTGSLWTEEHLPTDTLLYAPLHAMHSRNGNGLTAEQILQKVNDLNLTQIMLGGNETVGRGIVCLHFLTPGGVAASDNGEGKEDEVGTESGDGEGANDE